MALAWLFFISFLRKVCNEYTPNTLASVATAAAPRRAAPRSAPLTETTARAALRAAAYNAQTTTTCKISRNRPRPGSTI